MLISLNSALIALGFYRSAWPIWVCHTRKIGSWQYPMCWLVVGFWPILLGLSGILSSSARNMIKQIFQIKKWAERTSVGVLWIRILCYWECVGLFVLFPGFSRKDTRIILVHEGFAFLRTQYSTQLIWYTSKFKTL